MKHKYDAIVVGGGVIGGSIAYNLAKRGSKVLLLEKDQLASKSSGAAAGMLGAQAELEGDSPLFPLAKRSREMFPHIAKELQEVSGVDIEFVNKGMFKVALSNEEASQLKNIIDIQRNAGEEAEWFSTEELQKVEPLLANEIKGGIYIPKDGQVSAPQLSKAFFQSAAVLGAEIKEFTAVHSFIFEKKKVIGVETDDGNFYCENIIVANGAWSRQLLEKSGLELTVYPVKGECFFVKTHKPLLEKTIFSHGCYLVPKSGGRILVGATVKPHSFDRKVSLEGIATLMEKAKKLLPVIAEAEWEKAWAGTRPQTADGLPYISEHPEYHGLFIATGHFRNGILLSPITGELTADLVERKVVPELDVFNLNRSLQPIVS